MSFLFPLLNQFLGKVLSSQIEKTTEKICAPLSLHASEHFVGVIGFVYSSHQERHFQFAVRTSVFGLKYKKNAGILKWSSSRIEKKQNGASFTVD